MGASYGGNDYGTGFDYGNATYGSGTPDTQPAPTSSTSSGGFGGASYLDWLKFAASLNAANQKGHFVNVPQTPEQKAAYQAALGKMNSLPDANSAAYPLAFVGASSAPQLDMDKLRAGESGAYKAPYAMTTNDLTDILQKNKTANATAGGAATGAPPPPPVVPETTHQKRKLATGILTGAIGGLRAGPYGAIAGGVAGGLGAKKNVKSEWDQNHSEYNAWLSQYGSQFTDAQGKPVKAPQNMKEYEKWYQAKYGTPYNAQAAAPGAGHVNIADTVMDWWKQNHYGQQTSPPTGGA